MSKEFATKTKVHKNRRITLPKDVKEGDFVELKGKVLHSEKEE